MNDRANIQAALIDALKDDASVAAKVAARINDLWRPGSGTTYPKIQVGFIASQEPAEFGGGLQLLLYQISIYTANCDVMEAVEIGQLVKNVLHATSLTVTGWVNQWNRETGARVVGVDDTGIVHYAADYLIAVTESS